MGRGTRAATFVLLAGLAAATAGAQTPAPPPPEPAPCPTPTPPPPPPHWIGNADVGLSFTRGNADTGSLSVSAAALYDPKTKTILKMDALYLRADKDGEASVDRSLAGARVERTLTSKVFTFGELRYLHDKFKNIDYIVTPLLGLGLTLVKSDRTQFLADTSFGALFEKDTDIEAHTSGALRLGESFLRKLGPTAGFTHAATALYKTDDFGDALYHAEVALATSVTSHSELKVTFADDYKSKPSDPTLDKNDVTLRTSFVIKF